MIDFQDVAPRSMQRSLQLDLNDRPRVIVYLRHAEGVEGEGSVLEQDEETCGFAPARGSARGQQVAARRRIPSAHIGAATFRAVVQLPAVKLAARAQPRALNAHSHLAFRPICVC